MATKPKKRLAPKVLAFDPGGTTGWCWLDGKGAFEVGSFITWLGLEALFEVRCAEPYGVDVVVSEKFQLYPWMANKLHWTSFPTVEVIGVLKFLAAKHTVPVVEQPAKAIAHIRVKPALCPNKHAVDALCHALAYYRGRGLDSPYVHLRSYKPGRTLRSLRWSRLPRRKN